MSATKRIAELQRAVEKLLIFYQLTSKKLNAEEFLKVYEQMAGEKLNAGKIYRDLDQFVNDVMLVVKERLGKA